MAGNGCMMKNPRPPFITAPPGADKVRGKSNKKTVPYTRKVTTWDAAKRSALEEAVACSAPLLGLAAEAIGEVFSETTTELARAVRHGRTVGSTFMYPTHKQQRRGLAANDNDDGSICAHQLALRLAGGLIVPLLHDQYDSCAVHVDTGDTPRVSGCPLVYVMLREPGVTLEGERATHPMPASDLVIFEREDGGHAVRIQTACLDHMCIVIFASESHLHGNVAPDTLQESSIPGVGLLRLVPYARKGIDEFVQLVEASPQLWSDVLPKLGEELRARVPR